jgi:two-component sensor histidine kinase
MMIKSILQLFRKNRISKNGHLATHRRLEASAIFNAAMRQAETRQQALDILLDQSLQAFSADAVGVYQTQDNSLVFAEGRGLTVEPPSRLPADGSHVLGRSLYLGRILKFTTKGKTEKDCDFCIFLHQQGMNSLIISPLQISQKAVGVLYIAFHRLIKLQPDDEQLLHAFSEAAGNTIHRFVVTEQLEQTVSNRNLELSLLYDLMEIPGQISEMDVLLRTSLNRILEATNSSIGAIHFLDPTDQKLKLAISEQFSDEFQKYLAIAGFSDKLWTHAFLEQEIVQLKNVPDSSSPENPNLKRRHWMYLGVPIRSKNKTIGILSLFSQSDRILSPWVSQMVTSATNVLGLTIENFYFRKHAEDVVILNERQRLARNLHDSVSQSLYALVISADVSEKLLRIKDFPGLRQQLRDLGKVALQGLKEMRLMLYEFRPASLDGGGLVKALEQRLNTVESRAGINTNLSIDGDYDLPPQMEQEIYQIIIESLNNSLKHAEASEVSLEIHKDLGTIYIEIRDNGLGFDQSTSQSSGGMGMTSMRERAQILGGKLSVASKPGGGTRVKLEAPLTRADVLKE